MRKAILMMLLAVLSNSAMADWSEVSSEGNITTYANPAAIRKTGNKVKMWSLIDLKMATTVDGKSALSLVGQSEFDCKEEQVRNLYDTYYSENMGRGEVVRQTNKPTKWMPVTPETAIDFLWKVACGKTKVVSSSAVVEWIKVDDGSLVTSYYNRDTIHKDGSKAKLWILYDHKELQESTSGKWKSMMAQSEYDCKKKQLRILAISIHPENMAGGEAIFTSSDRLEWKPLAAANSVEKMLWKTTCNADR